MECPICGSNDVNDVDALFYCAVCGTQVMATARQEVDDFGENLVKMTRVRRAGNKGKLPRKRSLVQRKATFASLANHTKLNYLISKVLEKTYPDQYDRSPHATLLKTLILPKIKKYIEVEDDPNKPTTDDKLAIILASFSITIVRGVAVLLSEMQFPAHFEEQCFSIWQRYLAFLKIAFCKEEPRSASYIRQFLSKYHLIAIYFLSTLQAGIMHVTLSDFIRWQAEDRFYVPVAISSFTGKRTPKDSSLSQYFRIFSLVSQWLNLPDGRWNIPILKICSRFLNNLNLPKRLIYFVRFLMKKLSLDCDITLESLRNQGNVYKGKTLLDFEVEKPRPRRYWNACFGRNLTNDKILGKNIDLFIAPETKIMALLLLTLKLLFGLNDRDEYRDNGEFRISKWLFQLKLRFELYRGRSLHSLLKEGACFKKSFTFQDAEADLMTDLITDKERSRIGVFKHISGNPVTRSNMRGCDLPFLERTDGYPAKNGIDKVYVPITAVVSRRCFDMDIDSVDRSTINEQTKETLLESYENVDIFEGLSLNECFALSQKYEVYPRPDLVAHNVHMPNYDDPYNIDFVLTRHSADNLLERARTAFSRAFKELIGLLASSIEEDVCVLYSTIVLLELRLIESDSIAEMVNLIANKEVILMKATHTKNGDVKDIRLQYNAWDSENNGLGNFHSNRKLHMAHHLEKLDPVTKLTGVEKQKPVDQAPSGPDDDSDVHEGLMDLGSETSEAAKARENNIRPQSYQKYSLEFDKSWKILSLYYL